MQNDLLDPSSILGTVSRNAEKLWVNLAKRYFALALRNDYLSNGRGHQQSRRAIVDRRLLSEKVLKRSDTSAAASRCSSRSESVAVGSADAEQAYLSELAKLPRLTSAEEYCLVKRMKAGDAGARNLLVESNLGLVVMLAKRYQRPNVPLLDLVAEGNLGLIAATSQFDPERGFRFATYAKWSVKRAVLEALPGLIGVVRVPPRTCAQQANEPVDEDDGMATENLSEAEDARGFSAPACKDPTSQLGGAPVVSSSSQAALDMLTIPEDQEPPETTQARQRSACLVRALATLSERERLVIHERFALSGDMESTLDDLSKRLGVSIERIRQIETAAVRKLGIALRAAGASMDTLW